MQTSGYLDISQLPDSASHEMHLQNMNLVMKAEVFFKNSKTMLFTVFWRFQIMKICFDGKEEHLRQDLSM